jgi:localization factor PodJL
MTQGPWSVKGIDPKARSIARERAQRRGVTLGEYLNSLLLDDDGEIRVADVDIEPGAFGANGPAADDLRRMSTEIDQLSQRLEASQTRAARAVAGIDKSILGLMGKIDTSGKAQLGALERVTRAMGEIESTQSALRDRIDTLEGESRSGPTLSALKGLESSLSRLAENVQERVATVEKDQADFRDLFDERVSQVSNKVDDVARNIDTSIANALKSNPSGLSSRVDQIETQMSAIDRRMEGAIDRMADAASRIELFENKADRAAESALNRSRAMSKELLDRVESIDEKTRDALASLGETVSRITDRLSRAERKQDTVGTVVERSINDLDERLARVADDITRPIQAVRADVERQIADVMRNGSPEKLDRLERTIRDVQDQLQKSESRQAHAVETMSAQVERLSRAVDERLRTVEARSDSRSIEDVRREMLGLADNIEARLNGAEAATRTTNGAIDALNTSLGRLNTSVDDRIQSIEQTSAAAIDAVGEQVALVAERLQRRHDETIERLTKRIDDSAATGAIDVDRISSLVDDRIRDSERRSAETIGQIGEQVARFRDRLQSEHVDALRTLESRLADSGRTHEARLSEVLADMSRRMDEIGDTSAAALAPVHKTVSSLAKRLADIEDGASGRAAEDEPAAGTAAVEHEFIMLEDVIEDVAPPMDAGADDAAEATDTVGVEPPPFDRGPDAHLFSDEASPTQPPTIGADEPAPATEIEDLLDADDLVFAPSQPPAGEFVADLPREESRDRPAPSYLDQARRAARQGHRVDISAVTTSGRKGIGRGPLLAASALAVAVAGGGAWTVMRGKQEAAPDRFAKLSPQAPAPADDDPAGAASVLFGDTPVDGEAAKPDLREPSAGDLFDEPATAPASPDPVVAAPPAAKTITLADAVANGDPVALHDQALELLQTGEKSRGVSMLKEAASKGLVMAQYRLAKLYEKGEGVPRDIAASRSWTEQAAIGGNVKAMHDLAVFYAEGDSGPQSYAAAVEWFRQASDLGLVDSQYNLAVLYEQGLGVSQDKREAAYWFEVAGRSGDSDGARRARALMADMPAPDSELIKRRARAFNPKPAIARANGEFGKRPWNAATPDQISEMQRLLERLGYAPGAPDGKLTAKTQSAIRAFEADNDLTVNGEADIALLRQLRAVTLNAAN